MKGLLLCILTLLSFSIHVCTLTRIQLTKQKASYQKHYSKANNALLQTTHFMARIRLYDYELMQYSGDIKLGSDLTSFQVIFDTGSAYLWVASSDCSSCVSSGFTQSFDCSASSSCDSTDSEITVSYGTGSLQGTFVEDTVQIGDYTAEDQEFIIVYQVNDFEAFESNGILGLGTASLADGKTPLVDNLKSQGQISSRIFSFYLGGRADSYLPQFTLDGYDERLMMNGTTMTYCSVIDLYYWAVDLQKIIVQGVSKNYTIYETEQSDQVFEGIVDTGTSLLVVDTSTFDLLLEYLNNFVYCTSWEGYILCLNESYTSFPNIVVTLCGNEFVLTPEDYLEAYSEYQIVLIEAISDGSGYFILGDTFIRKFYTVFDQESNTIGFALAARGGPDIEWEWSYGSGSLEKGIYVLIVFLIFMVF